MTDTLRLELGAEPGSVFKARQALSELAFRLGCDVDAIRTAVSELVGNAVNHAYAGREPGPIIVLARVLRGRLVVTVADRGRGIQPTLKSPGPGLGLPIVSSLASDVRIDSDNHGSVISAGFDCQGAAGKGFRASSYALASDLRKELDRAREALRRNPAG